MKHHHYTDEEKKWLLDQDSRLTYRELTEVFNSHFGTKQSVQSISDLMSKRLKAVSRKNNSKKGHFKKGAKPKHPVGAEIEKDGYIWVKVNDTYFEGHTTNDDYCKNWKRKSEIIWEEHNGAIPEGHFIVFLDGNKKNCDIKNLYMVDRKTHVRMAQNNWYSSDPDFTLCALKYCELIVTLHDKTRGGELSDKYK